MDFSIIKSLCNFFFFFWWRWRMCPSICHALMCISFTSRNPCLCHLQSRYCNSCPFTWNDRQSRGMLHTTTLAYSRWTDHSFLVFFIPVQFTLHSPIKVSKKAYLDLLCNIGKIKLFFKRDVLVISDNIFLIKQKQQQ